MNGCEQYEEAISALVDNELSKKEEQALREHMRDCEPCRGLYADFMSIHKALARLEPPPETLAPGILYKRSVETVSSPRWRRVAASLVGVAACLLLALFLRDRGMPATEDQLMKTTSFGAGSSVQGEGAENGAGFAEAAPEAVAEDSAASPESPLDEGESLILPMPDLGAVIESTLLPSPDTEAVRQPEEKALDGTEKNTAQAEVSDGLFTAAGRVYVPVDSYSVQIAEGYDIPTESGTEPVLHLIRSVSDLKEYVSYAFTLDGADKEYLAYLEYDANYLKFSKLAETYDEDYFQSNIIAVVYLADGSSSYQNRVMISTETQGLAELYVQRYEPPPDTPVTADMAYRHMFVELEKAAYGKLTFDVIYEDVR